MSHVKKKMSALVARGLSSGMQWHDGPVPSWPPPTTTSQPSVTLIQVTAEEGGRGLVQWSNVGWWWWWGYEKAEMPEQKQEVAVSQVTSQIKLKNRAFLGKSLVLCFF